MILIDVACVWMHVNAVALKEEKKSQRKPGDYRENFCSGTQFTSLCHVIAYEYVEE